MICQKCQSKPATTFVKKTVNGQLSELALCNDCAAEMGYTNSLLTFDNILGSILGTITKDPFAKRCPKCGSTFDDISRSGKVGCKDCYEVFEDKLLPLIQRIHGTTIHKGKSPGRSALTIRAPKSAIKLTETPLIDQKRLQLKNAIAEQRFEDAALLRDEIKEMENNE